MARRRRSKSKSHRKTTRRRRRRNGAGLGRTAFLALMAKGKRAKARKSPKRRKARKSSKRKSRAGRRIRPVIISSRGKLYRPRRSKTFPKSRRVNGRRRRSNGKSLVSSIKSIFQVRTISRYASIGGGIFAGTLFSRMLNTGLVPFTSIALPASITTSLAKVRPFHGLLHILAGSLLMTKVRGKYAQDVGVGLAALGGFDLLMQVLSRVGVKNLPTFSGMNVTWSGRSQYAGDTYPGAMAGGMNVDLRRGARKMAGYNVDLMGEARHRDAESEHLADSINDMLS